MIILSNSRLSKYLIRKAIKYVADIGILSINKKDSDIFDAPYIHPQDVYSLLESYNKKECIFKYNTRLSSDIELIFQDILLYYKKRISKFRKQLVKFRVDKLKTSDDNVANIISEYENQKEENLKNILDSFKNFNNYYKGLVKKFEENERDIFANFCELDLKVVDYTKQINVTTQLFYNYVEIEEFSIAKKFLDELKDMNYVNIEVCNIYLAYTQGIELNSKDIEQIKNCGSSQFINRIKIQMSELLKLSEQELIGLVNSLDFLLSGKEYYYLAVSKLKNQEVDEAINLLFESLNLEYFDAANLLLNIWQQIKNKTVICKNKKYNTKLLDYIADYIIPEACYELSLREYAGRRKKSNVYMKLAASKQYIPAIRALAFEAYNFYSGMRKNKKLSDKSIFNIKNLIEIYKDLIEKNSVLDSDDIGATNYNLFIGELYYLIGDYSKAYNYLSNLNEDSALYICAEIFERGNGKAKDIKKAKELYSKIMDYKDSRKRYTKLKELLKEKEA